MIPLLKKVIPDQQQRTMKKYRNQVEQINALETEIEKLTDEELRAKTNIFKEQLANGYKIEDIRAEAFAVVREASKRVIGLRHFDVQLIGGLALSEGNISEMATGEGKTLVASLPSYLRALEGKGVHVITVNDYLAKRDRELIGPIHEFLGLTVGLNIPLISPDEKKKAYNADITYGVGVEFGFDFLRDNIARTQDERVQRPYHYAILDEVDSVLIDEAKTPLILATKADVSKDLFYITSQIVKSFEMDTDFFYDPETKATNLTEDGISKVENSFSVDNLYDLSHQTLYHYVIQSLRAEVMFKRDEDYIVKDGEVHLVDPFTGRIMEGRSLSNGLHQAIEAKEGLTLTEENKTQASITIQNYFRKYPILSGMTGTAKTEEKEFQEIYGMDVVQIPTNRPVIRQDMEDRVFLTRDQKYLAVAKEVKTRHEKGQPILIGTTSIRQSEMVANYLDNVKVTYQLLNAKSVEHEANIISLAGQKGHITIATNMAGRGTDILLGEGVAELGGLHVIGTERHESRRVDNQLKGRSGRQGDPGSSQFFVSMEDDLIYRFAGEDVEKKKKSLKADENGEIFSKGIHEFFDKYQKICEGSHFSNREYTLKLDDVINEQRKVIYELRDSILTEENIESIILPMVQSTADALVQKYISKEIVPEEWPLAELENELNAILSETIEFDKSTISDPEDVNEALTPYLEKEKALYHEFADDASFHSMVKQMLLSVTDFQWTNHLEAMEELREGIGLRGYGQEDPQIKYQEEGFTIFTETFKTVEKTATIQLANIMKQIAKIKGTSGGAANEE